MKIQRFLVLTSITLILIVSCQGHKNTDNTLFPTETYQILQERTPTPIPINNKPSPTGPDMPLPSPTSFAAENLPVMPQWLSSSQGNTLWVRLHNGNYWVMDYPSKEELTISSPPYYCPKQPYNASWVICEDDNRRLLLYDLITHQEEFIGISADFWIFWEGSIYYLPYKNGSTNEVYAYNLGSRTKKLIFSGIDTKEWDGPPFPSTGAKYFIVHKTDDHLYKLDDEGKAILLSPHNVEIFWGFALSPIDQKIAYAGTYIKPDVGVGPPTDAFLTDLETGLTHHFLSAIKIEKFLESDGWPVWSPDGGQLAVFYDNWLCLVNTITSQEECIKAREDSESSGISTSAWSQNGKFIAYIVDGDKLAVLNLEDMTITELKVENGYIQNIYWR